MLTDVHRLRAENLHLYGLLAHWTEIEDSTWVAQLLDWEEAERARRSLERRLGSAHIGRARAGGVLDGGSRHRAHDPAAGRDDRH